MVCITLVYQIESGIKENYPTVLGTLPCFVTCSTYGKRAGLESKILLS